VYKPDGENSWKSREDDSSFTKIGSSSGISTKDLLATLKSDLAKGDDLLLNSKTTEYDQSSGPSHGMTTLVGAHVMSIVGIDGNGDLEIRNPWGTRPNQTFETTFTESLSYLNSLGDSITVDDVGKNVSQLAQAMAAFSPPAAGTVGSPVQSDAASTLSHVLASPMH
jgi:hypothetical protein